MRRGLRKVGAALTYNDRLLTVAVIVGTLLVNGAGWLIAIWFGWEAFTLGLQEGNPAMFFLRGAVAWVGVCMGQFKINIKLK